MNIRSSLLDSITQNNFQLDRLQIKKVLILYEEKKFYIGDTCILFDKIKYVKTFFPISCIDINFVNEELLPMYNAFLLNNPFFNNLTSIPWDNIDFSAYSLIICVTFKEEELLDILHSKYRNKSIPSFGVVSMSKEVLLSEIQGDFIFPNLRSLECIPKDFKISPSELFISNEERVWANEWLESKGMKSGERLFVLIDSASNRDKLLRTPIYFQIVDWLLSLKNIKILIFDERKFGKRDFYEAWLGSEKASKFIFSEGKKLREDLALISSHYTKLVFGPCTGLMHCSSSIFNNIYKDALSPELYKRSRAPLLITIPKQQSY